MVFMYHPSDTQMKLFFFVVLALQSIWNVENAAQLSVDATARS